MLKFKSVSRIKKLKFKWVFIRLESGANMLAAPPPLQEVEVVAVTAEWRSAASSFWVRSLT